jgi:hypothetical protein
MELVSPIKYDIVHYWIIEYNLFTYIYQFCINWRNYMPTNEKFWCV